MARKHKLTGKGISVPAGIAIGAAAGIVITILGALLLAYMIANEAVGIGGVGFGAMVIALVSSVAGAWLAWALTKKKRLLVSGLTALMYYLILLCVTAVFFDGLYDGVGLTALVVLAGAGASLLVGFHKKPGKNKIKIPAYR